VGIGSGLRQEAVAIQNALNAFANLVKTLETSSFLIFKIIHYNTVSQKVKRFIPQSGQKPA
jgi:hypothetical protein